MIVPEFTPNQTRQRDLMQKILRDMTQDQALARFMYRLNLEPHDDTDGSAHPGSHVSLWLAAYDIFDRYGCLDYVLDLSVD